MDASSCRFDPGSGYNLWKYPLCESVDYRADIYFLGGVADDFFPVADDFFFSSRWRCRSVDKGNF